jgi:hypothetical protein
MTWFRVDDSFYGHPKAVKLANDSLATWTRAGEWCAWQLTDGVFPRSMLPEFAGNADDPDAVADDLLDRKLWELSLVPGHLVFHDWGDWNPTRAQVLKRRKADADRRAKWLASRRDQASGRAADHGVSHGVTDHGVSHGVTGDGTGPASADTDEPPGSRRESRRDNHGVSHTSPTRPDPTRRGVVGEGDQSADRSARAGWTPHDALSPPPARKPGGGPRTTHSTVQDVIADAHRPGGPAQDVEARADEARKALANRQRALDAEPDAEPRALHGEALAREQLAAARTDREPLTRPAPEPEPADAGPAPAEADADVPEPSLPDW